MTLPRFLVAPLTALALLFARAGLAQGDPSPASSITDSGTQAIVAFDAANKLYEQGKFAEAAAAYQRLIDGGQHSVTLFFNLGNAWFKAGQAGRAIAAYRQAEQLSPRDPSVQFNLAFARKSVTSGEPAAAPLLDRLIGGLTLNEWTVLTMSAFWAAWLLLAVGELRPSLRGPARRQAALVAVAGLLLAAATALSASRTLRSTDAVVVVPSAVVRAGPLEEAKVLHQLRSGTEVSILDQKQLTTAAGPQTWFQVRSRSAEIGWMKEDQLTLLSARLPAKSAPVKSTQIPR